MKNKLEQLLNSLVKAWWKPFNRDKTLHIDCYDKCKWLNYKWVHLDGWFMNEESRTLRELVSEESWLWQFCTENWLTTNNWNVMYRRLRDGKKFWIDKPITHYTFRLIESALKEESELEDFLLSSIKID